MTQSRREKSWQAAEDIVYERTLVGEMSKIHSMKTSDRSSIDQVIRCGGLHQTPHFELDGGSHREDPMSNNGNREESAYLITYWR